MHFINLALFLSAVGAAAVIADGPGGPLPRLEARTSVTCGSVFYVGGEINAVAREACSRLQGQAGGGHHSGHGAGGRGGAPVFPHAFDNPEGFRFPVVGPYVEFPILRDGDMYEHGAPGPDRVIINSDSCALAGVITHENARGNGFRQCDD